MPDVYFLVSNEHPDDIKSVLFLGPSVTVDPTLRRFRELALFAVVHCFYRITELSATPCFHFDECDRPLALHH